MNNADLINNDPELARAQRILDIAAELYAYCETQGRVRPDENMEMWIAKGENYNVVYNPSNANFFVEGTNGNEMVAQRIEGQLDFDCVHAVTEADAERFVEIQETLASREFDRTQSPTATQAKAEAAHRQAVDLLPL